ncbi:MAG: UvrD-helicase domain-containing protein, partial [Chloroflexi bacterium]|nr:UvrD-helicase domain-containing protein [Chloroflexota bacterium]
MIEQLNPAQRLAVETTEGPVLIVAGPGSGKTRVIVHRIAHLIAGRGVPPWHVLAVTFTNRAAREMLTRLQGLLPRQADSVTMGTFHAVFARILRRDGARIGVDSHFVIYDDGEQLALVKRALGDLNLDEKYYPARAILHQISLSKSVLRGPQEYANQAQSHREEIVAGVYRAYQERLAKNRALDFDDILSDTVRLFREHPDVLEQCQERYRYILVDEFQDTNVAQYELVKLLGRAHRNVCVVGDEDQSIYSWRSANIHNILDFGRDFPGSQTVVLDQNYRSTQMILTAAQGVIQANRLRVRDKHLWTANPVGQPIVVNELSDADHEASYVASEVARHLVAGRYRPRDIAVMFRTNAQSRAIEQQFLRDRIPHRVIGVRFWERQEVKDVLAYLRVIVNPADNVSFTRIVNVPPRGIGARTVAELDRWAGERGRSLADALACAGRGERQGLALGTRAERALAGFAETLDDLATAAGERTLVDLISSVLERTGYDRYLANDTASGEDRLNNVEELMGVAKG